MNRSDDFTRANDPTTLGTPSDGGTPWTVIAGTWGIISNQGYSPGSGANTYAVLDCGANDATTSVTANVAGTAPGLAIRVIDAYNFQEFAFFAGTWFFFETVAGVQTLLTSVGGAVASGDVLTVLTAGSSITCQLNGTTILTATSSNLLTATEFGIFTYADPATRFTDFAITTGAPPPPASSRGLINTDFTYWEYKPATATTLSRLTFWMVPRNVLLYDAAADAALIYLQAHTPAALQF